MVSSRPLALDNKHVNIIIKICVIKLGELIKRIFLKQGDLRLTPDERPSGETWKFSLYFSCSCIPTNESLFMLKKKAMHVIRKK